MTATRRTRETSDDLDEREVDLGRWRRALLALWWIPVAGLVLGAIVGVLSERDCVRRLVLAGKSAEATPVADIMVRDVIKADLSHTFVDCLRLMHTHRIRHLPVVDNGTAIDVVSVRDLLNEAVTHHAKVIGELERERMMMLTSTA